MENIEKKFKIGQIIKCIKAGDSLEHNTPLNELFTVTSILHKAVGLISIKTGIQYNYCNSSRFILPNRKLYKRILLI